MKIKKVSKNHKQYPPYLLQIASVPKELYYIGEPLEQYLPAVTIVGSRKISPYGQDITYKIAFELARLGITIVSGLALGVDGVAHQAAVDARGRCIAVLAGGLDSIHPATNRNLAIELLKKGGTIVSEYPVGTPPLKQNFIARNRIVAALSDITLVTESAEYGGSLVTARFALEHNKLVAAVPGNITSEMSVGTNNLIKAGASPVTSAQDVLDLLGVQSAAQKTQEIFGDSEEEQIIIDIMKEGITELDQIQTRSGLDPSIFSQAITMLEISAKIRPLGAAHWTLS